MKKRDSFCLPRRTLEPSKSEDFHVLSLWFDLIPATNFSKRSQVAQLESCSEKIGGCSGLQQERCCSAPLQFFQCHFNSKVPLDSWTFQSLKVFKQAFEHMIEEQLQAGLTDLAMLFPFSMLLCIPSRGAARDAISSKVGSSPSKRAGNLRDCLQELKDLKLKFRSTHASADSQNAKTAGE